MIHLHWSLWKRKRIKVNDLLSGQYSANRNVKFKTPMLRSDLRDYSGAYIIARGIITVANNNWNNRINKMLALKNNAPFRSYTYQ